MKLSSSFSVPAAPDKVLALFLDPATMQACIPGCEGLVQSDETHYQGTLVNEVAHVKFTAGFKAEIVSLKIPSDTTEPAEVVAVLKGEDRRLGSTVKVDAVLTVSPHADGESSEVHYAFELAMWGKLGRLGESVIRRRTTEVERQFAEALTAVCSGQPVPQPAEKRGARRATRASSTGAAAVEAGAQVTEQIREVETVAVPGQRSREDWTVLGLAVAAAFAYGMLFGRRGAQR